MTLLRPRISRHVRPLMNRRALRIDAVYIDRTAGLEHVWSELKYHVPPAPGDVVHLPFGDERYARFGVVRRVWRSEHWVGLIIVPTSAKHVSAGYAEDASSSSA